MLETSSSGVQERAEPRPGRDRAGEPVAGEHEVDVGDDAGHRDPLPFRPSLLSSLVRPIVGLEPADASTGARTDRLRAERETTFTAPDVDQRLSSKQTRQSQDSRPSTYFMPA